LIASFNPSSGANDDWISEFSEFTKMRAFASNTRPIWVKRPMFWWVPCIGAKVVSVAPLNAVFSF
jgi:hypothetical protein